MSSDELDETLYPQVAVGSKIIVWRLEFPPERRGNEIWTRLLEEVEVEIVEIEQQDHQIDPNLPTKAFIEHLEADHGRKYPQEPFRRVLGKDASGRKFRTHIAMQFAEKNRIKPGFAVLASIKQGGESSEWWTPELFRRYGWHLIEDEE